VVEGDFTIDYRNPATGFSSVEEFNALYLDQSTTSMLIVMTHSVNAGATTEKYRVAIDIPLVLMAADTPDRAVEGETPIISFSFTSLLDEAVGYPIGFFTTDQSAAY
jgi:hypothetical protein